MARKRVGRPKKNSLPLELQKKIEALEGETDKSKIKELKDLMKLEPEVCGALQKNGQVCVKAPWRNENGEINNGRCAVHKGKPNTHISKDPERRAKQLANLNPKAGLIHGMYSKDFKDKFTKEEVEFYNETVNWFVDTYPEDADPINLNLLHRYAINAIKTMRQESTDFLKESRSQNSFEKLMSSFVNDLGLNKRYKDSKENKDNKQDISLAMLFDTDDNE
ncbi:hypothetical protein EV207_11522 [Scopulibacillus darangshiensis]|uniref:Uncharacterized protein n=1 Tax=Scopulibacillus darangshiensis TaxID=442528 RepID=A0A4V2SMV9_9BACL|nr:hypothetical protein [Scopulibacillus darangshiensis]TCP28796.1 hypothetical protein EV207_11522 [Scopulibacillus darangshiensis]